MSDPRFPDPNTRAKNRAALTDALDPTFRTRTTAEWLEKFNGLLPAAPVYRLDQALDSDFARATGMVSAVPHPAKGSLRVIANPLRIDGERLAQAACSPLGADNDSSGQAHMKLEGIKVVDLSWFLPGPYLTTRAGRSRRHGDQGRAAGRGRSRPPHPAAPTSAPRCSSATWRAARRASCSTSRASRAAPICSACACEADVIVESFRPGVAARFGIGYDAVKAKNPGIVYCSISAFGQDGAYPGRAAHDLALEAMTGVLSLTLGDDGRPADARHSRSPIW